MIIVRDVFQAKFGRGDELVQAYKEMFTQMEGEPGALRGARLLTDLSGTFFTVVLELEFESLAAWEEFRRQLFTRPEFAESFARSADAIESGRADLYTLEAEWKAGGQ